MSGKVDPRGKVVPRGEIDKKASWTNPVALKTTEYMTPRLYGAEPPPPHARFWGYYPKTDHADHFGNSNVYSKMLESCTYGTVKSLKTDPLPY